MDNKDWIAGWTMHKHLPAGVKWSSEHSSNSSYRNPRGRVLGRSTLPVLLKKSLRESSHIVPKCTVLILIYYRVTGWLRLPEAGTGALPWQLQQDADEKEKGDKKESTKKIFLVCTPCGAITRLRPKTGQLNEKLPNGRQQCKVCNACQSNSVQWNRC